MGQGERIAGSLPKGPSHGPPASDTVSRTSASGPDGFDARCARPSPHSGGPTLGLFFAIRHILDSLGPYNWLSKSRAERDWDVPPTATIVEGAPPRMGVCPALEPVPDTPLRLLFPDFVPRPTWSFHAILQEADDGTSPTTDGRNAGDIILHGNGLRIWNVVCIHREANMGQQRSQGGAGMGQRCTYIGQRGRIRASDRQLVGAGQLAGDGEKSHVDDHVAIRSWPVEFRTPFIAGSKP